MTRSTPPGKGAPPAREDRLKAALKANLARRKAQAKARGAVQADKARSPDGPGDTNTEG